MATATLPKQAGPARPVTLLYQQDPAGSGLQLLRAVPQFSAVGLLPGGELWGLRSDRDGGRPLCLTTRSAQELTPVADAEGIWHADGTAAWAIIGR